MKRSEQCSIGSDHTRGAFARAGRTRGRRRVGRSGGASRRPARVPWAHARASLLTGPHPILCQIWASWVLLLLCASASQAQASCPEGTQAAFERQLEDARAQLLVIEYSAARSILEGALECLASLDGVVPNPLLGRLFQDLGVARLQLGDERGAIETFRRAAVMSPEVRWEPRLGNRAMGQFLSIKEDVLLSSRRDIVLPATLANARVALDGVSVGESRQATVFPGTHFLQVRETSDAPWLGLFIEIPAEDAVPPLPNTLVGKVFRSNTVLITNPRLALEARMAPGPGRFVKRTTVLGAGLSILGGAVALSISYLSRASVLEGRYSSFAEGEELRLRSNRTLGVGLALTGVGLSLGGAGFTMFVAYPESSSATQRTSR